MKNKLKALEFRLTELSSYLNYSRPTLYKFIDDYESKKYDSIDYKVKIIFDFIMLRSTTSKIEVINKIIEFDRPTAGKNLGLLIDKIKSDSSSLERINELIELRGVDTVYELIMKLIESQGGNKND